MQKGIATLEDILECFKELNILLWFGPAINSLGIYTKELKKLHRNVYNSFTYNCQNLEVNGWTVAHQQMEYFSVIKKSELSSHEKS